MQGGTTMQAHRKTLLFRQVNDTIDELLQRFGAEDDGSFFCECPKAACARRLALTPAQYEAIRKRGAFVVARDCALDVDADVLAEEDSYVVVSSFRLRVRMLAVA
jgi:hypothetical protein